MEHRENVELRIKEMISEITDLMTVYFDRASISHKLQLSRSVVSRIKY